MMKEGDLTEGQTGARFTGNIKVTGQTWCDNL